MDLATQVSSKKVKKQNGPNNPKQNVGHDRRNGKRTMILVRMPQMPVRNNTRRVLLALQFCQSLFKIVAVAVRFFQSNRHKRARNCFCPTTCSKLSAIQIPIYPEPPDMMSNKKMISFSQLAASHLGATSSKGEVEKHERNKELSRLPYDVDKSKVGWPNDTKLPIKRISSESWMTRGSNDAGIVMLSCACPVSRFSFATCMFKMCSIFTSLS